MGTLGDLTGGYITGKNATEQWKDNKQNRRMKEQLIAEGELTLGGKRRVADATRKKTGAEPRDPFQGTFADPFAAKMTGWIKGLFGGTGGEQPKPAGNARALAQQQTKRQALPVTQGPGMGMANGGPVTSQVGQGQQVKGGGRFPGNQRLSGILFMADGGDVDRRNLDYGNDPVEWQDITGHSSGGPGGFDSEEFKKEMGAAGNWIKEAAGTMVSALGKAFGADGPMQETGEMARQGTAEIADKFRAAGEADISEFPGALGDLLYSGARTTGATAAGAVADVGRMTGLSGGDEEQPAPAQTPPPPGALAPPDAVAPQTEPAPAAPGTGSGRQALPVDGGPNQQPEGPIQEIGPEQMPNMGVDEWAEYRREVVTGLVEQGMNPEEAFRTVDQTVTGMQQRGFLRHLKEAQSLMQAGDQKGAIRALYAGYQYFPNGKDVRFGVQNGKIIGLGFDEKTGERTKGGMVLDPESIDVMIQNFGEPGAFKTWTMDWREFEQELRKYSEIDKPLAEQQGRALATNAQARLETARSGGGAGSYDAADMDRNRKMFVAELDKLKLQGVIPQEYDSLAIAEAVGAARARYPYLPPGVILRQVLDRYEQTLAGQ